MQHQDEEDVEAAARKLRILLGIDDLLRPDMITVIYKLKHHGMIRDYLRVPDADMPDNEAYFDSAEKMLYVRESTFRAANALYTYADSERRRARYTIAHEVAHVALGHQGIRHRGDSSAILKRFTRQVRVDERAAERFAAAFLAPAHLALGTAL